ncbi:MAG TPA: molybdopterin-synthase adenylyltransferase MoeB [Saprospiraceae bacterium]|nr:molybdopterin-synthase adenylyltransferase MoeB [Saprospiraceae bacterium]HNT19801.1 molybdopterin-synthase adenylyltransferase MoeB [Saprospiraceae bacterium]
MTVNGEIKFSPEELARYSRHLILPEFNIEGQKKLKQAKVLVVGTGGLGAPLLLYLAAAGVGTIGLVDFDVVDDSNLQRQVLFTRDDLGIPKVIAAKKRLEALNPFIKIIPHQTALTSDNALDIIRDYDVVADGTDNFPTRYLVNDACVLLGKVNVYASIYRFEGQATVFNYKNKAGELGPNYRDLFPTPPPPGLVPSCAEGGVLGVLPGILGSIQASEVIKVLSGVGEPLSGRLFLFDAATFETRTLKIKRRKDNPLNGENPSQTGLIDYQQFCGFEKPTDQAEKLPVKSINVKQLQELIDRNANIQIVDVREAYEYEIANIHGELMPKSEVTSHVQKISKDKQVIVHCRSGKRSADVIEMLQEKYGFDNLYNLEGGILAWAKEIDQSMPTY